MSIPARLYNGYLLIYGSPSISGITSNTKGMQFGTVNQIFTDVPGDFSTNQSVMFKVDDSISVNYGGAQYFIIEEQKIVLIENPLS